MNRWKKTDESLINLARENLEAVGFMDGSIGAFGRRVGESVMELIKTFASQEHTAFTYQLVAALFSRLAKGLSLDDEFCQAQEEHLLRLAESTSFDEDEEKILWVARRYGLPSRWMPDLVENLRQGKKPKALSFADAPLIRDDDVADDEYASLLDKNDGAANPSITTADDMEEKKMNLQQQVNRVVGALCEDLESFTSIDVSNKVKETGLKVRHREVAHLVRTSFANGDLDRHGYVRDLIKVTLKSGKDAQAYLYRHSTVSESAYDLRTQVALPPGQNKAAAQAPAPTPAPAPKLNLSPRNPAAVPATRPFQTPLTPLPPQTTPTQTTTLGSSTVTRVQKGDGRLEIPGVWMTRLGWTENTVVYAVRNGSSILLTRNTGLGADILRKFTVDRWGRIRLTTGTLNRVGKNRGTGGQHTLTLNADSIRVD